MSNSERHLPFRPSRVAIYVMVYDALRQRLLLERGFQKTHNGGMFRQMRLGHGPELPAELEQGYALRTTRPDDPIDCQRIADLLNAAFGRDFHTGIEYQVFTQRARSFRNELDLVAEAPDGSFAAYAGIPYDEANGRGIFEPVCTHPDHQRRGLARSLMLEGLRRLRAIGAAEVSVDTGDMIPANRLYEGLGFTEAYPGFEWRKSL